VNYINHMTDKKNILTMGLVVVAVLVIIESIILVDKITNTGTGSQLSLIDKSVTPKAEVVNPDLTMSLRSDKGEVGLGEPVKITVNLTDKSTHKIDGIEVYVKYDLSAFDIIDMEYSDRLPKPDVAINSTKKGLVLVNYLISTPADGFVLDANELKLLSFMAVPKKAGDFNFEINTDQQSSESVSIVAEHALNGSVPKSLPLASNPLTIRVIAK